MFFVFFHVTWYYIYYFSVIFKFNWSENVAWNYKHHECYYLSMSNTYYSVHPADKQRSASKIAKGQNFVFSRHPFFLWASLHICNYWSINIIEQVLAVNLDLNLELSLYPKFPAYEKLVGFGRIGNQQAWILNFRLQKQSALYRNGIK